MSNQPRSIHVRQICPHPRESTLGIGKFLESAGKRNRGGPARCCRATTSSRGRAARSRCAAASRSRSARGGCIAASRSCATRSGCASASRSCATRSGCASASRSCATRSGCASASRGRAARGGRATAAGWGAATSRSAASIAGHGLAAGCRSATSSSSSGAARRRSTCARRSSRPARGRTSGSETGFGTTGCSRAWLTRFPLTRSAAHARLSGNSEYPDVARVLRRRRIRIIQDALSIAPDVDIRLNGDRDEKEADRY
jgi:hypothetical protein